MAVSTASGSALSPSLNAQMPRRSPSSSVTRPATSEQPATVYRAHYIYDGYLVRVEAYGEDSANVEAEFEDILGKETDEFPPSS